MTNAEWTAFTTRLFVEYPSLYTRLERTIDMEATLKHWRTKLSRFEATELNAVLDFWDRTNASPWDSFAVEQAVSVIANVATKARDRRSAKVEVEHIREAGRKPRTMQDGAQVSAYDSFDSPMAAAYAKLRPIHKRYKDGELSESDWFMAKYDVLEAMK
jgi:hypothetical protein